MGDGGFRSEAAHEAEEARLAGLMAAAQEGDAAAYQAVLRACVPAIRRVANAQGVPADRIDDVIQDVLLTIHRARHTYDPARPFLPWLRAIARRRAVDILRSQGRQRAREVHAPLLYEAHPDPAVTADDGVDRTNRARALREAVATLPPGQRQAAEELGLRERTLDQVAASTGRSKGALKVNLHRALQALRAQLARAGLDDV